jgi:Flp pilus assembly protein TadG
MNKAINLLTAALRRLKSDDRGGIAIITAVSLPVLVGFCALAVDVSIWLSQKNSAQGAADFAALSAEVAAQTGASSSQVQNEALDVAALNGFTNGQNGITVTVNNPPTSGSYTTNNTAYEVIITQPQQLYFAAILGLAPTVRGRAVVTQGTTPACVLALDTSANQAIDVSGSASINAPNCAIASNSSSSRALNLSGSACVTASQLSLVGNYNSNSSCHLNVTTVKTNTAATQDPYSSFSIPSFSGCGHTNYSLGSGSATISPGVYCGGISTSSSAVLTMNPGVYIIDGGDLAISGSSQLNATSGVTIILTSTSSNYGTVAFSGGSTENITAPSTGSTAGIALYLDRRAPKKNNNFSGGSSQTITGAIYMPSQQISYTGPTNAASSCTQLIGDTITFSGSAGFGRNCGSVPVAGLQGAQGGLVE